jgi:hypothetical protein
MRPKGYATAAIMMMNQSQWKGPYPYIQPSIIIGASEQHQVILPAHPRRALIWITFGIPRRTMP